MKWFKRNISNISFSTLVVVLFAGINFYIRFENNEFKKSYRIQQNTKEIKEGVIRDSLMMQAFKNLTIKVNTTHNQNTKEHEQLHKELITISKDLKILTYLNGKYNKEYKKDIEEIKMYNLTGY